MNGDDFLWLPFQLVLGSTYGLGRTNWECYVHGERKPGVGVTVRGDEASKVIHETWV